MVKRKRPVFITTISPDTKTILKIVNSHGIASSKAIDLAIKKVWGGKK